MKNDAKEMKCSECWRKVDIVKWVTIFVLTGITAYWIYQVGVTYASEPVTATISMINNNTFTWPTFTFCPRMNCFNKTALIQLSQKYNLTLANLGYWDFNPFDVEKSNFNWDKYNYSEILSAAMYKRREDVIIGCEYLNTKYYNITGRNCLKESSELGTWKSYNTQYSPCHSFTPSPAINVGNFLRFYMNPHACDRVDIAVHDSSEQYFMEATPIIQTFSRNTNKNPQVLVIKVREFQKVNRARYPCETETTYSESDCYQKTFVKYLIQQAGCYIPAVTGYQKHSICKNNTMFKEFSYRRKRLSNPLHYQVPVNLQQNRKRCLPRCHKLFYDVDWKNGRQSLGKGNSSNILVYISGDGMLYMRVKESFSLTADMLVSDIGGTMGLFLGVSGLSFLSFFGFFYEKMMKIIETNDTELQQNISKAHPSNEA